MASIKDVAQRAGVSIATVSRVMNNSQNVRSDLSEKVIKAAKELDYTANVVAQSLRCARTHQIAVIIPSLSRTFFTGVLDGINAVAGEDGYRILLAETHDDIVEEIAWVNDFVARNVDGIILASSAYGKDENTRKYLESLGTLESKGRWIPVVSLEYSLPATDVSSVIVNTEQAAFEAVDYLIHKNGREKIVYISLPREHYLGKLRYAGYKRALREAKLPLRKNYVLEGDYSTYSGYRLTNQMIDEGLDFDGIFCANDQMAVGAILACNERNLRIPEDVSVMGNDDVFAASLVRPSLSSIHVPQFHLGQSAMKLMQELQESEDRRARTVTLSTRIVERNSTNKDYIDDIRTVVW